MIQRGDIRWFRFKSPDKRGPVVVLGGDRLLPFLNQIPVIPLSTQIRGLPWEVPLSPEVRRKGELLALRGRLKVEDNWRQLRESELEEARVDS